MSNKKYFLFLLAVVSLFFVFNQAQAVNVREVIINEINWAGSSSSSADEWIELRNASTSAINLNGWTIKNLIPGATTTISTTTGFSTTTIPGSGFFLIGNATSGYSAISDALAVVYATNSVDLIDSYTTNGALALRDDTGALIDETPASSTSAWPGGAPGPATSTMARNFGIGQGASTTSWHTSIIAANFDAGILDKGTPGSYNGYSFSGLLSQLNGDATGTIYILARQFGTTTATATANFATTGAYSMHLFEALYDFFGFRNSTGTGASYDTGEEPLQTLNNNGLGYNSTSSGLTINFDLALNPSITNVTPSSANIGDTITISGRHFGNSTSSAQGNVYIPQNILATDRVASWSSTSIQVVIPPTASAPGPQTGTLQLKIGWTPTTTASLTIKPKIATSTTANENLVIVNFDSYMNGGPAGAASNYTLYSPIGTPVSLSGAWTEFRGNRVYIKGISLTANNTFSITVNSNLTSIANTPIDASFNNATGTVAAAPKITSLSPATGTVGTTITITGANFGTATGTVYFSPGPPSGGQPPQPIPASTTSWSATQIAAVVPQGAKSGPIFINTASGLESDFSPSSFFDVSVNLNFKILKPDGNSLSTSTARIIIGKMGGPTLYYAGDGITLTSGTANNATITIPNTSSAGFNWVFDSDGTYLASRGQEVNSATTTVFNLASSTTKISGVISGATANRTLVIFADPVEGSGSQMEFKEPNFFKTNANGTTSYNVGISATGTYIIGVEDPGFGGTASSSPKLAPAVRTVNASTTTAISGINFTFTEATARIHGKLEKATGGFTVGPGTDAFHVWAYQPIENGLHASAMIDASGEFDLYVNPGVYLIEAGGPFIPFAVKEQIEVKAGDANFATSNAAIDITLVIKAPTEYIAGQVADSAGNGVSGASIFAWLTSGGFGGGQAFTDSNGYYKLYLSAGTYTVEGFTPQYGKLTSRSGVTLSANSSTTVDFAVSSELATISGTVVKNNASTSDLEVWITVGDSGYNINRTKTGADGTYSLTVPYGSGYYLHIGKPGQGEIYKEALATFNSSNNATSGVISVNTANVSVRISPVSSFSQAFIEARNTADARKRGFSNKDVSATSSYREYVLEVPRPASGSLTYVIEGGIPGYGPLTPTSTSVASDDTSKTILITLGNMWTASGTISDPDASTTGNQAEGAFVWASGASGHGGGQVSASGTFSFTLKEGTYDFGIDKKNYSGAIVQSQTIATDTIITGLSLSQSGLTIAGQVTAGGTAESGAWVWAGNGSGGWAGDQTDGSGNYNMKVTSGTWTVRARSEGYESPSQTVTVSSGTSTLNIALSAVSGYTSSAPTVESITPRTGGIIQGTNVKLDLPAGALSSQDSNTGRVSIQKTTSIPTTNSKKALGNSAYEISAYNSSGTSFTVLNSDITISLTYSASDLSQAGVTQAQASQLSLGYWDSTANTFVSIPTNAATTSDGGVIYTGTTNHLSPYAPLVSSGDNPPPTPTGLTATAYHRQVTLRWTASSGATKYDVYRKSGDLYPYLAQTTAVTYDDSGLTNGTTYYYKVSALNNDNDESVAAGPVSATPQAEGGGVSTGGGGISTSNLGDTVPPSISDIKVSAGDAGAGISWKTNESSISWLVYGTSTLYGSEIQTATSILSHSLTLTRLSAATTYHYQIKAKDSAGNTASYTDQTFTTLTLGEKPKVAEAPVTPQTKPITEMTVEELSSEITRIMVLISQLQSQFSALQGQAPAGGYDVPSGFTFAKNLSQGMSDLDVVNLKKVLDVEVSDHASWTGTGLFGSKVKAAVVKFQQKYNIGRATGFVGSLTRAKLNQLISK